MANDQIALFNFYFRQLWTAQNFTDWQTGMVDHSRGIMEGTFGAAVLGGFGPSATGMDASVSAGIAVGPTGYLNVINEVSSLGTIAPPTGDFERALVVVRPNIVESDFITVPPQIATPVPAKQLQESLVALIRGVESVTPQYPATEANDVILCGLRLYPGQTSIEAEDIDLSVRDIPGKNSNFQQDQAKYDDRFRPYINGVASIGLKPSQLEPPLARAFSYVNKTQPSIFPKTVGGLYNGAAGDTFLNMTTGAITGADQASSDFVPQVPAAGSAIVASIAVRSDDTLVVEFGTSGTRAQCYDGILNQATVGAGSVSIPNAAKLLAFVICYSDDGAAITEMDLFDCRGAVGTSSPDGGALSGGTTEPGLTTITLSNANDGELVLVNTSLGDVSVQLPAPVEGYKVTIKDADGEANFFPITLLRDGSEEIERLASDYVLRAPFGMWTVMSDGTDWFVSL